MGHPDGNLPASASAMEIGLSGGAGASEGREGKGRDRSLPTCPGTGVLNKYGVNEGMHDVL